MIYVIVIVACIASALIVWAACAIYWAGHYSQGLIDGRAEAMESRITQNRAMATARPPTAVTSGAAARVQSGGNVIDLAAWRQWAEQPALPLPDAPTITMGQVIPVPTIGTSEVDAWIEQVLTRITERIYGP